MANSRNHFELLGVPVSFHVPMEALDLGYRELQSKVHPDRFVNASDAERRVAMQLATNVNEAYKTLKNPLHRAIYLLELQGIDVRSETNTTMEPAFLMQQIEWRENIEDARAARNLGRLESLHEELLAEKRNRFSRLEALFGSGAMQPAAEAARQLLFIERLEQEIGDGIEAMESA
jgi:molecular chaperone HscB